MFTCSSKKFALAVTSLLALGLAYAAAVLGLHGIAIWAERRAESYPYWAGEDSIRYLVPTLFTGRPRDRLLLIGPSRSQDGLLLEEFAAAFPQFTVVQGSISSATLDDILLALEYIEKSYGTSALPRVLVAGIDVRTVSNYPRHFGSLADATSPAPFLQAIRDYSFRYTTQATADRTELRGRTTLDGLAALSRFYLGKQQPRYRAGLTRLLDVCLNGDVARELDLPSLPRARGGELAWHRQPLHVRSLLVWCEYLPRVGLTNAARRWSREFASPYDRKYRLSQPLEDIEQTAAYDASAFWRNVYDWDPRSEEPLVRRQLSLLREFTHRRGIELYLVNMPEHRVFRQMQVPEYYQAYLDLVRECLPEARMLDAYDAFGDEDFHDNIHLKPAAAARLSRQVAAFIEDAREKSATR